MAERIDSRQIKLHNRRLVYDFLTEQGEASKQEIVSGLRLSLPTVTSNLDYLLEKGWVEAASTVKNTGGRNAVSYRIVNEARMAIGVSLTGHHMNVVSVDLTGQIHSMKRIRIAFDLDSEEYMNRLAHLIDEVKTEDQISEESLLGVGVAIPSIITKDGSEAVFGMTYDFTGKTWSYFENYLKVPGRLFHDSYTAGYSEWRTEKTVHDAFYIMLGTSVGGAFIHNDTIYEGDNGKGSEIGHMTVLYGPEAQKCYCGRYGCFDTVCNMSNLDSLTDGRIEDFFALLKKGDPEAKRRWDRYLDHLAFAVNNIRNLFDIRIILGGYVGACMDEYMPDLYRRINERNSWGEKAEDYVFPCMLKKEPVAVGAAQIYVDEFLRKLEI